ncbi:hypothetical protein CLV47_102221 [Antricoccus suffuscus]|uniref:Uncharacterized protein n=1 Tax=Antricoccus suffuscus TaxID=1629062 RepID=A0A2T1A4L1_9ACTN|nr:hypothetical protein CLV47_102221 [Antricoccus suffuscus]
MWGRVNWACAAAANYALLLVSVVIAGSLYVGVTARAPRNASVSTLNPVTGQVDVRFIHPHATIWTILAAVAVSLTVLAAAWRGHRRLVVLLALGSAVPLAFLAARQLYRPLGSFTWTVPLAPTALLLVGLLVLVGIGYHRGEVRRLALGPALIFIAGATVTWLWHTGALTGRSPNVPVLAWIPGGPLTVLLMVAGALALVRSTDRRQAVAGLLLVGGVWVCVVITNGLISAPFLSVDQVVGPALNVLVFVLVFWAGFAVASRHRTRGVPERAVASFGN